MAATYDVTSPICTGAGSLTAAVAAANASPGADVIRFTAGMQVEVSTCHGSPTSFFASVTDDVTFEGNGAKLVGHIQWITTGGLDTPLDGCPRPSDIITAMTPGFLRVADNKSVVVKNLSVREVHGIAEVGNNASLVLEDFKAERVLAFKDCTQNAVAVGANSNLTLRRNEWRRVVRWGLFNPPVLTTPAIQNFAGGNLVIEDSSFRDLGTSRGQSSGLVYWNGAAGSTAKIVSTRMQKTGGIVMSGDVTSHIVNSVWATDPVGDPDLGDRIVNDSSGEMTIAGSTIMAGGVGCGSRCFAPQVGIDANGLLRVWDDGSKINLVDTGVGVLFDSIPGSVLNDAAFNGPPRPGKITANGRTWIQPGNGQDAAALKTVTGQPNLLTDPPGLMRDDLSFELAELASPLLGTPGNPGKLIDVIAGGCTSDKLVNPIDGSDIVTDAFGNPRCDANGRRNIGAVQTFVAPHLAVRNVGDGLVSLGWSRPADPVSGPIAGYEVCHGTGAAPDPAGIGTTCPGSLVPFAGAGTLAGDVTGLANGTLAWFLVRGVNPSPGPWSNLVSATPVTVPGAPGVTATPGDGIVALSWTPPASDGGSPTRGYLVYYRHSGDTNWTIWPTSGLATAANIGGLTNGSSYEFEVKATNAVGIGPAGTASAVPQAPLLLHYPTPVQITAGSGTLQLYPTYVNVVGTPSYAFVGSTPSWLSIDPNTGVVTATNPTSTGSDYTQDVTISLTRSGPPAGTTTALIQIEVLQAGASPRLYYPNYEGPAGSPVSITPSVFGLQAPYAFSNTNANLPPGLALSDPATGVIAGMPATVGSWTLEMRVVDTNGVQRNAVETTIIGPTISYPAISGTVGSAISARPAVPQIQSGRSYSYALSGTLPPGLAFNTSTGEISGTPSVALSSALDVTVSAALSTGTVDATTHVRLTIADYTIDFSYPQRSFVIGQPFSLLPTVIGTIGPVTYAVEGGLPNGVTLNPNTGELSGTMTSALAGTTVRINLTDRYSQKLAAAVLVGTAPPITPVPALNRFGLLAMILLALGFGYFTQRRW